MILKNKVDTAKVKIMRMMKRIIRRADIIEKKMTMIKRIKRVDTIVAKKMISKERIRIGIEENQIGNMKI